MAADRVHSRIFRTQAEELKENNALNVIKIVPLFAQDRTYSFLSMGSFGVRRLGSSPEGDGNRSERCA